MSARVTFHVLRISPRGAGLAEVEIMLQDGRKAIFTLPFDRLAAGDLDAVVQAAAAAGRFTRPPPERE